MRGLAADGAAVGGYHAKLEAQAGEDTAVGLAHGFVGDFQRGLVDVKRVGIFHDELACPHHPEAGPDFIAKLRLDLVVDHWELAIALDLAAENVGDHFLVSGAEAEIALVAVPEAQKLGAECIPALGFDPQLGRLHRRKQDLQRPGPVHLLADDVLDATQHPDSHGQPRIDARSGHAHQTCPQHESMADDLRLGGGFFEGGQREVG